MSISDFIVRVLTPHRSGHSNTPASSVDKAEQPSSAASFATPGALADAGWCMEACGRRTMSGFAQCAECAIAGPEDTLAKTVALRERSPQVGDELEITDAAWRTLPKGTLLEYLPKRETDRSIWYLVHGEFEQSHNGTVCFGSERSTVTGILICDTISRSRLRDMRHAVVRALDVPCKPWKVLDAMHDWLSLEEIKLADGWCEDVKNDIEAAARVTGEYVVYANRLGGISGVEARVKAESEAYAIYSQAEADHEDGTELWADGRLQQPAAVDAERLGVPTIFEWRREMSRLDREESTQEEKPGFFDDTTALTGQAAIDVMAHRTSQWVEYVKGFLKELAIDTATVTTGDLLGLLEKHPHLNKQLPSSERVGIQIPEAGTIAYTDREYVQEIGELKSVNVHLTVNTP